MTSNSNVSNSPPPTPLKKLGWHDYFFLVLGIVLLIIGCILIGGTIWMMKVGDEDENKGAYMAFGVIGIVAGFVCLYMSEISNPGLKKK